MDIGIFYRSQRSPGANGREKLLCSCPFGGKSHGPVINLPITTAHRARQSPSSKKYLNMNCARLIPINGGLREIT